MQDAIMANQGLSLGFTHKPNVIISHPGGDMPASGVGGGVNPNIRIPTKDGETETNKLLESWVPWGILYKSRMDAIGNRVHTYMEI